MKISFILPGGGRSGGIKSTVKAANGLIQRGHDVRLLVNGKRRSLGVVLRHSWLSLRYPDSSNWLGSFEGRTLYFSDIRECEYSDEEIVIASGSWAGRELSRLEDRNITKVHFIRGMPNRDVTEMQRFFGEDVPKIAVASYLTDIIRETCGQEVVAVIPNGVHGTEYYPSVPESQRDGIGTIFGNTYHKDPKSVLNVLQILRKRCPQIPQRVFGTCCRPREIPRRMYCRLPGIEEAREIYSRSIVWILGSCSEGFPVPVLEAMACGCAVVATDCGGPRDIIKDGENGFLVEVGNVGEIVDRVQLLLRDPDLRQRLVRNSKETVKRFTWESSVDKLERVLQKIDSS